jgi:hypothetical protein
MKLISGRRLAARHLLNFGCLGLLLAPVAAGWTQIYLPDPKMDIDTAANTYFGSTKDVAGRFLSGVTVEFSAENTSYIMVTDDAGRFKLHIPKYFAPNILKFNCSKPGFVLVRATKRRPPGRAISPVQADCMLAPKGASAR